MDKFRSGVAVVLWLAAVVAACNGSPTAPTGAGLPVGTPPPTVTPLTLEVKGRVRDDLDRPVAGATVAIPVSYLSDPTRPEQATTDTDGVFVFTATVRTDEGALDEVPILIDRNGYESVEAWIAPETDTTITMYPTTTIVRGSTLRTRIVATAPYACGFESHRCRRIVVEPAGKPVFVEILEADGGEVGLMDGEPPLTPFDYADWVTISDGELFIIGGPATVTLRASPSNTPPGPSLTGQYSLTLTHGCAAIPDFFRTRTYTASIEPAASGYIVTLGGAEFLSGSICTMTTSALGCNQFLASQEGDRVRFDMTNADEWHGGYITEAISPGLLEVSGSVTGRLQAGNIDTVGHGTVWYCPSYFPCRESRSCEGTDLRLSFKRQ